MARVAFDISGSDQADSDFLALPYTLYAGEPEWRAPLRFERKAQLSAKNPTRAAITARFFVARRAGQAVGRIAAFINTAHDQVHGGAVAFFGYFDCEDDPALSDGLLNAAKDWARSQGRTHLRGPAMWSVNEEVGLLVDGFEHPPAVMMPYGHPHQVDAITRNGFEKSTDLYAYLADLTDGAPSGRLVSALRGKAETDSGLTWRSMNTRDFMGDVRMAREIFNDAWSDNWGYVPFSEEQFSHMAKEMKPIMFKTGFQIGFVDGEPAAFIWMIPDLNEVVKGLNGRLLPFGWAQLLWRIKAKKVTKGRVPLMGLKRKFHKGRRGVALTTQICSDAFDAGQAQGFTQCELSWILEGNRSMTSICELVGAEPYKTYRMVEAEL
ncbi:DNA-binding protein [Algimonas arctica]|uniref:DNA-binding protein n=1 Tax=Algimonas arctica TaxID=1479486 RepID=A0A8J3CPC6_9PROT|nr:hypothetical protein [Algimonas arctica]GHA81586.1 DNA-binding protein [Algimonas arctica]